MNDQKHKIKLIYKVMIFAIILTFVLTLTVVPAFADESQITNLIGTTWRLDVSNFSTVQATGSQFYIVGNTVIDDPDFQGVTIDFTSINLGYYVDGDNSLISDNGSVAFTGNLTAPDGTTFPLNLGFNSTVDSTVVLYVTITGGEDISNPLFIDFINTYGTLVTGGEEVTSPTIYDVWDDILQWVIDSIEETTAAFYVDGQLTLLGYLCVIPFAFGLCLLVIAIIRSMLSLR